MRLAPGAGGGEVDPEGTGSAVGGENFAQPVAEWRESGGEGVQAGDRGHAGEVQGVTSGVEVAFEDCGIFASEGESSGSDLESGNGWGGGLLRCKLLWVRGVGG